MKKFWKLTNSVDSSGSTLILDGPIASESWWGDEVTPQEFRNELKKINTNKLEVIINSVGGDVWAGVAIYDALKGLDAEVTVKVSGLAASIASVIAMAGDKITITPGSTMMVHRASTLAMGNADDLEKAIEMLQTVEDGIIDIYAERTGQTKEQIRNLLDAETWMSAEKAVELGFADEVVKPEVDDEEAPVSNIFSGNFALSMSATKESVDNFVKKVQSDANDTAKEDEAAEPTHDNTDEPKPTDKVEPVVEDKEIKSTKEEVMEDNNKTVATDQIIPEKKAAPEQAKPDMQTYLKSKNSIQDFANVLAKHAGEDPRDVKAAWQKHLGTKMGITNPEVLLPAAVVQSIEDAFKEGGQIWNLVNKTGLDVYKVAWDTVEGEDSRAKGYNRSVEDEKAEEVITLADRTIRPQFIYKYLTIPKEVVKENRSTGALLQYVLSELPKRIVREVERAIVIGDGRAPGSAYKINSFVSLKADAAAGNVFAQEYVPAPGESKYESLVRARALVKADGAKYLIASDEYMAELLLEQNANGGYLFAPGTNLGQVFGFAGVISPDWMDEDTDNEAYIFTPSQYRAVGDNTIESFTNFALKTNTNEYLQEIWAGGALSAMNAAVAITAESAS